MVCMVIALAEGFSCYLLRFRELFGFTNESSFQSVSFNGKLDDSKEQNGQIQIFVLV